MQLSKRLETVAGMVQSGGVVADVGCDHGFTSIFLVKKDLAKKAVAMDINPGPIERAREHIAQYEMEDRIETRLSDGLDGLTAGEADTILISGMGGALMRRILERGEDVVQSCRELVLSPQSENHLVRMKIQESGFAIDREEMLLDQGKYYVVIHAVPGEQHFSREEEYTYGKDLIDRKHPVLVEYLGKERNRLAGILERMPDDGLSEQAEEQFRQLSQQKEQIQDLLIRMRA